MDQDTRIENKLNSLDKKIDYVVEQQHEMKITLVAQHVTLQDHTRRSTSNEETVKILKAELEQHKKEFDAKVDPLIKDKYMISGALKFVGIMVGVAGIVDVILRIFFHR